MSISKKLNEAKTTNWITEGLLQNDVKSIMELAKISAKLEMKRIDLGMTQKEFANFMGVSQSMVSKWESREYNFTISSLNEICDKIGLIFEPIIRDLDEIRFEQIKVHKKSNKEISLINKITLDGALNQNRGIA